MWETEKRIIGGPKGQNLPDHGSEGWVWTDGKRGLLILKYNHDYIEFSIFKGEITPPGFSARFGGAGLWRGDPEYAARLEPGSSIGFGVTRYEFIRGGWKQGYYAFRDYLASRGNTFPADYNPPVHWNELYNLDWNLGSGAGRYTLDTLFREAEIAADIGCEALYLDPCWDTVEGSAVWDEEYFGIGLKEFVTVIREKYGLKVSLHLFSHTNNKEEFKGMYSKDREGNLVPCWRGAKICPQSRWKEEKAQRLLRLAEAGVDFLMFDFHEYDPSCYDPDHGHEVPLSRQRHAEGLIEVMGRVREKYPHIYIEAHDRITAGRQDYHQLYYQYDPKSTFDENWGFEYMWDSYLDLISGKAVSLYDYNLAYEIPLYLHINIGQKAGLLSEDKSVGPDNENLLAFWWYASTVRHLGLGGVKEPETPLYKTLKHAMARYMSLKEFYTRGKFYGIDEMIHVHTLPSLNQAVINLFNVTGNTIKLSVTLKAKELGLKSIDSLKGTENFKKTKTGTTFKILLEPLSPALLEVNR
jgi:hypothetical protein